MGNEQINQMVSQAKNDKELQKQGLDLLQNIVSKNAENVDESQNELIDEAKKARDALLNADNPNQVQDTLSMVSDEIKANRKLLEKVATKKEISTLIDTLDQVQNYVTQLELIFSENVDDVVVIDQCKHGTNCQSIKYLVNILALYKRDTHDCIESQHKSGDVFRVRLLNHYHHLLTHHKNEFEDIYNLLNKQGYASNSCDISKCLSINRYKLTHSGLKELYGDDNVVEQQLLDTIHCYYMHSFDRGYRLTRAEEHSVNNETKTNDEQQQQHDLNYKSIHEIIASKQKINDDEKKCDDNEKFMMTKYSNGYRYYYWDKYKEMHNIYDPAALVPITQHVEQNSENSISYWWVKEKFMNLKDELLNNAICTISAQQCNNMKLNADVFLDSNMGREMKWFRNSSAGLYGLTHDDPIQCKHLMAIKIYTDFDILQRKFSETYRKLDGETNEELKERHRNFYFLGKYLRELVECYGMACVKMDVYHGIQQECIFSSVYPYIKGPFSVSQSRAVAVGFSMNGNGMLLELKIDNKSWKMKWNIPRMNCFDCSLISKYSHEQEILFLGGLCRHIIQNIIYNGNMNYDYYIKAIRQITFCMTDNNVPLDMLKPDKLKKKDKTYIQDRKLVFKLMSNELYQYHEQLRSINEVQEFKNCPEYIEKLLHNHCKIVKAIVFGDELFPNEEKQNFVFKYFFQLENKWANLQRLTKVFPKLDLLMFRFDNINVITNVLTDTVEFISKYPQIPLRLVVVKVEGDKEKIMEQVDANKEAFSKVGWNLKASVVNEELIDGAAKEMGMSLSITVKLFGLKLIEEFKNKHQKLLNGLMIQMKRVT